MKVDELTHKGISRLLNGEEALVQIIDKTLINRQGMKFYQYQTFYTDAPSVMATQN